MNVKQRTVFVVAALLMLLSAGCTDYNLEDTGLADGNHNTTMLEYFKGDPYNFDSLQVMIGMPGWRISSKAKVSMATTLPALASPITASDAICSRTR